MKQMLLLIFFFCNLFICRTAQSGRFGRGIIEPGDILQVNGAGYFKVIEPHSEGPTGLKLCHQLSYASEENHFYWSHHFTLSIECKEHGLLPWHQTLPSVSWKTLVSDCGKKSRNCQLAFKANEPFHFLEGGMLHFGHLKSVYQDGNVIMIDSSSGLQHEIKLENLFYPAFYGHRRFLIVSYSKKFPPFANCCDEKEEEEDFHLPVNKIEDCQVFVPYLENRTHFLAIAQGKTLKFDIAFLYEPITENATVTSSGSKPIARSIVNNHTLMLSKNGKYFLSSNFDNQKEQ